MYRPVEKGYGTIFLGLRALVSLFPLRIVSVVGDEIAVGDTSNTQRRRTGFVVLYTLACY